MKFPAKECTFIVSSALSADMLVNMFPSKPTTQYMDRVRELIREKGLSRHDLELLEEIIRLGALDLLPLLECKDHSPVAEESRRLSKLRKCFGIFLAFLNQFPNRHLGDMRLAMGLVIQHSLGHLGDMAKLAHREILEQSKEAPWVMYLLDLITSLRTMSTSLGSDDGICQVEYWKSFLVENRGQVRELFQTLGTQDQNLLQRLNQEMKALNQALKYPQASGGLGGRPQEHLRRLEALLESMVPEEIRTRTEPFLLLQHVIASLLMSLAKPLDRGINWPAVEQVRGSLQWLWNHLGWTLPRIQEQYFEEKLPPEVRGLLRKLKQEHTPAFMVVARALASHLALLSLVEQMESAGNTTIPERYAAVPIFFVVESELGRLAERVYNPKAADQLPKESEETLLLGAFLRQAVLSLLQDQATIRGLLQQTLANNDVDQLAGSLDNLKALLLNHQQQLMADLVGLFSPELRKKLFPDASSLAEEGDRLRQRLHRLWEFVNPATQQIQVHLELNDLPRLALALGQAQNQVAAFRRCPEYLLIRSQDRHEIDRLTQPFLRVLDEPEDIGLALREASELLCELLRFLDQFLLRINARVPLIRLDLNNSREACDLAKNLSDLNKDHLERSRVSHKMIQSAKALGVRDAQVLTLLKRWVRSERSGKDTANALNSLVSHLEHLAKRLEAALD